MPGIRRFCDNHPDRPAIGVCVVTGRAICAECSTRYEGVNYSKEGLEIMLARRAQARRSAGWAARITGVLAVLAWPPLLLLIYQFTRIACTALINFQQTGDY